MKREWVVYRVGPWGKRRGTLRVSLDTNGRLRFNHAAYEKLGCPEAVELVVDERNSTIGLRAADPAEPHTYPVGNLGANRNHGFSCLQFLKDKKIPIDQKVIFPTARVEDNVLILELKYRTPARLSAPRKTRPGNEKLSRKY